jgi:hypothetical protein
VSDFRIVLDQDGYPRRLSGEADCARAMREGALAKDTVVTVYRDEQAPLMARGGDIPELAHLFAAAPAEPLATPPPPAEPPATTPPPAEASPLGSDEAKPGENDRRPGPIQPKARSTSAAAVLGTQASASPPPADDPPLAVEPDRASGMIGLWLGVIVVLGLLIGIALGARREGTTNADTAVTASNVVTPVDAPPSPPKVVQEAEQLPVGSELAWSSDSDAEVRRQAGPYLLTITREGSGAEARPVIEISVGGQSLKPDMGLYHPGSPLKITLVQNIRGAVPVLMAQAFTGGAHCCVAAKLIGLSNGRLTVLDLGQWDGEGIPVPEDISHDGIADFVLRDDRFLYAFASYASSFAPPRIYNVTGGRMIDVSGRSEFRELFAKTMSEAGKQCISGSSADERNGACPAYVAAAARLGLAEEAWPRMLGAYDGSTEWSFPTGCVIPVVKDCPEALQVKYASYPEALLHFLKDRGYLAPAWKPLVAVPPEAPSGVPPAGDSPAAFR